ncbi:hypothetical protein [Bradyrhizobium sp. Tv2a-2]|uniref:hypothetical protein n=1 Tax=Bradyrhizobium sp. Tv2a-2 TaxID=113395 RepID=UPI0012EB2C1F|nr:hypothetical protein [Bradyrhizobium sp. Tv2a-2]
MISSTIGLASALLPYSIAYATIALRGERFPIILKETSMPLISQFQVEGGRIPYFVRSIANASREKSS